MTDPTGWAESTPRPLDRFVRTIATVPCVVRLTYSGAPHHTVQLVVTHDSQTIVLGTFTRASYREAADDLAAQADHMCAALVHAACQLRGGPEPCE